MSGWSGWLGLRRINRARIRSVGEQRVLIWSPGALVHLSNAPSSGGITLERFHLNRPGFDEPLGAQADPVGDMPACRSVDRTATAGVDCLLNQTESQCSAFGDHAAKGVTRG